MCILIKKYEETQKRGNKRKVMTELRYMKEVEDKEEKKTSRKLIIDVYYGGKPSTFILSYKI